jgi:two-component system nitrate/nitrite response regulator NarL
MVTHGDASPGKAPYPVEVLRVFLIGEDPLARQALTGLLAGQDVEIVGESGTGDAFGALPDSDVVLLDLGVGEGAFPDDLRGLSVPVVVVLTDDARAHDMLGAGARGVLLRESDPRRLARALGAAAEGLYVFDEALGEGLLPLRPARGLPEELTPRETEVLQLLAQGLPNRSIAERLGISDHTAKFHVNAILGKLGAETRTEAVVRAARLGLVVL